MTIVKSKTKLKKSAAAKKRHAEHHKRHTNHYLKAYWPYLPLLSIFGLCLLVNNLLLTHSRVLGASSNLTSQSLLADTNLQRANDNEQGLNLNQQLENAAQNKANDMVKENFWSHISPSGETPWQYIEASGYSYQQAGENLAYGFSSASDVLNAWMGSQEHRQNILNSSFQDIGFGIASSPNFINQGPETIIVAEYAEPVSSGTVANITFSVPGSGVKGVSTKATYSSPNTTLVSRVQTLTSNQSTWIVVLVSFITGVLVCYFVYRHFKQLRRMIRYGEKFAASHIFLDVLIAILISAGFLLTRTSGFIH